MAFSLFGGSSSNKALLKQYCPNVIDGRKCGRDITNGRYGEFMGTRYCYSCYIMAVKEYQDKKNPEPVPEPIEDPEEEETVVTPEPTPEPEPIPERTCPWCRKVDTEDHMAKRAGGEYYCLTCAVYKDRHDEIMSDIVPDDQKPLIAYVIRDEGVRMLIHTDIGMTLQGTGRRVMTRWGNVGVRDDPVVKAIEVVCDNRTRTVEIWEVCYDGSCVLLGHAMSVEIKDVHMYEVEMDTCRLQLLYDKLPAGGVMTKEEEEAWAAAHPPVLKG